MTIDPPLSEPPCRSERLRCFLLPVLSPVRLALRAVVRGTYAFVAYPPGLPGAFLVINIHLPCRQLHTSVSALLIKDMTLSAKSFRSAVRKTSSSKLQEHQVTSANSSPISLPTRDTRTTPCRRMTKISTRSCSHSTLLGGNACACNNLCCNIVAVANRHSATMVISP